MPSTIRTLSRLSRQVAELAALAAAGDAPLARRAAEVSGWAVGEHVEHLALTDLAVLNALEQHERGEKIDEIEGVRPTTRGVSLLGRAVLLAGWIPRGRGRAPRAVLPGTVDCAGLCAALTDVDRRIAALAADPARVDRSTARAPHPYFGNLTANQWLRFLDVHHGHHRRIVRDIERRLAR